MQKILEHSSPHARVAYLLLLSLAGSYLAGAISSVVGGDDIRYYRIGILLQDFFVMFLPAYTLFRWISDHPMRMMGIRKTGKMPQGLLYGLLIFTVSYPAIAVVARWNEQLVLPDTWKNMEDAAKRITDLFLSGKTLPDLFLNLLIIAAAAAFAEEIFFRGALQQLIEKWLRNGHAAVWTTAFIFSAIHLQFYGFLPRLLMGAVLGYLFLYSRNLWIPMLYHFVNNAAVVVITYFSGENNILKQLEDKSLTWVSVVVMVASGLLTCFVFSRYSILHINVENDDSN